MVLKNHVSAVTSLGFFSDGKTMLRLELPSYLWGGIDGIDSMNGISVLI